MAIHSPFSNCGIFMAGYDLTGDANMVELTAIKEVLDGGYFGALGKIRRLGLEDVGLKAAGLVSFGAAVQEGQMRAAWGDNTVPMSFFIPGTSGAAVAIGDLAMFFQGLAPKYTIGGQHGQLLIWNLDASNGASGDPLGLGYVLSPGVTAVTADGALTKTAKPGAVAAGQYALAVLHVVSVSAGDSIIVTIESAATEDTEFASPTTRFTFASKSAIGAQYAAKIAGPITDTLWRAKHDVTGSDVSIKYACAVAVR